MQLIMGICDLVMRLIRPKSVIVPFPTLFSFNGGPGFNRGKLLSTRVL